jgi:hypothetical protein
MIEKDTLHRGAKIFMDSETAESYEEAIAILLGFRLICLVGPEIASSATLQIALLTAVNLASRSFLGGVTVHGVDIAIPNLSHLPGGATLAEAVIFWGGHLTDTEPSNAPTLVFGSAQTGAGYPQALRITFDGWRAAVSPLRASFRLEEREVLSTAGVVAASLGVSEAFQHLCGNAEAMRRTIGISLWDPHITDITAAASEPDAANTLLPQRAWLLGLGHLGQAYLWSLLALPYATPEKVTLVLHDFDKAIEANLSTSILTTRLNLGVHKTRFLAEIAQARGYQSVIQERPFDERLRVGADDPSLLLCGVDSAHVRRQIGSAGFREIIEAGIGNAEDYLDYQIHSFPAARSPEEVWKNVHHISRSDERLLLPAYKKMQESNKNQCGIVQIADISVGVPFVGAFVSGLVIAEAIRATMMGSRTEIIDGSLSTPCQRAILPRGKDVFGSSLGFLAMA